MIVNTDYAVLAASVALTIAMRAEERIVIESNNLSIATAN
jgi:uncharacterized protein YaiL (DUF2058 family)